jgi:hypothetical protein
MASFEQSAIQKDVQQIAEANGFKRARVQDAIEVFRVHYEHPEGYGFYIWEYEDGGWDRDYGYATKEKLPALQAISEQLQKLRSKARTDAKKLVIFDTKD